MIRGIIRSKDGNLLAMNEVVMAIEIILIDEMVSMFLIIDKILMMCVEEVCVNNVPRGKKRNARWFNRENLRNLRDEAENVSAKGKRTY
jgi:hypothetical protein